MGLVSDQTEWAFKMVLLGIVVTMVAIDLTRYWVLKNMKVSNRIVDGFMLPIMKFPSYCYDKLPHRARVVTALIYGVVQAAWFVATYAVLAVVTFVVGSFLGLYQLSKDIAGLERSAQKKDVMCDGSGGIC